jgi:3-phytase
MRLKFYGLSVLVALGTYGCSQQKQEVSVLEDVVLKPLYITDSVVHDTDDPAIWFNEVDPEQSLIIGTDKDQDGALFVFDLRGKIIDSLTIRDIKRPNNVDVGYGLDLGSKKVDFAVTGERMTSKLRFYLLPEMKEFPEGGIEVYEGETTEMFRDLMGVAVYHDQENDKHYVIAGRKDGPTDGTYLWQYLIKGSEEGIQLELVRKFGNYSGQKEIEAIAVDHELGFIYYSDEGVGVRKYHADPSMGNEELALFATTGFTLDHEGISIYKTGEGTGYILVSDQEANKFHVFPREGSPEDPNQHDALAILNLSTLSSDGSESTNRAFGSIFPKGFFVAMSDDKTFQIYRWEDLEAEILKQTEKTTN